MKIIDDSIVGDKPDEVLLFRTAEELADPSYTLYAWIARNTDDENTWNLKFGMARKTVRLRLSKETAADAEVKSVHAAYRQWKTDEEAVWCKHFGKVNPNARCSKKSAS